MAMRRRCSEGFKREAAGGEPVPRRESDREGWEGRQRETPAAFRDGHTLQHTHLASG